MDQGNLRVPSNSVLELIRPIHIHSHPFTCHKGSFGSTLNKVRTKKCMNLGMSPHVKHLLTHHIAIFHSGVPIFLARSTRLRLPPHTRNCSRHHQPDRRRRWGIRWGTAQTCPWEVVHSFSRQNAPENRYSWVDDEKSEGFSISQLATG